MRGFDRGSGKGIMKEGRSSRRVILFGAASALALLPFEASARIKVRFRAIGLPGQGNYSSPDVLKPDQLERCVKTEKEINASSDTLDSVEAALSKQASDIERIGPEIDRSAAQLDRTSQTAVDTHNAKVQRYQATIKDYNAQIAAFNSRADRHNAQLTEFNSTCANKKYYESDMQAVRARIGM